MVPPDPHPVEDLDVEDLELVRRIERGDRDSFLLFYERFFAPIHAFARRRCACESDAEALCERVLTAAVASLGEWRGELPLAAWVHAVAREAAGAVLADGAELARRRADALAEDRVEMRE